MPQKKLTALAIERLRPPQTGQIDVFDSLLPSFGVRVGKISKSYFVMLRVPAGDGATLRRVGLGRCTLVTLDEAREKARNMLRAVGKGQDPTTDRPKRQKQGTPDTVGAALQDYFKAETAHHRRGWETKTILERELAPWAGWRLDEVTRQDARDLIQEVFDRGTPYAAARLHRLVKRFFNWCAEEERLEVSPIANLKMLKAIKAATPPRERALKPSEIVEVWKAAENHSQPFGPLVRFLLVTGQRRQECAAMTWGEVDLDARLWIIPTERCKSERPHAVPLSDLAVSILESLPRWRDDHVFTSTEGRRSFSGFGKAKKCLEGAILSARLKAAAEAGVDAKNVKPIESFTLHDLRRTVRTELSRLGVPEIVAERVINHGPQGLNKVYDLHSYADEKRDALDRWARRLGDLIEPPPDNVVDMARKDRKKR